MNKQQAIEEIKKGNIVKETSSDGEITFYFKLPKDMNYLFHKYDKIELRKKGKYWSYSSAWFSSDMNENGEFEIADEKEFGGIDNIHYEDEVENLQTGDELREGKIKLVENLDFEKYGFSNKKVTRLYEDSEHSGEMSFKFNNLPIKCIYGRDKATFTVKIKLTKYSVAGEFFPKLKKIKDKIQCIIYELEYWRRVQGEELKRYSKKLDELSELKEKGDKYISLLEEGGEVKIYRFRDRYFADTYIRGSDNYSSQAMNYAEIDLNDSKILKLRKHTNINIKIYDLAPVGEGEDYILNV